MSGERLLVRGLLATVGLGIAAVVVYALAGTSGPPEGPVPVAWDREACARCRMHVGEPGFAVQLHLADGNVLHFDDPICYFAYVAEQPAGIHEAYFHHRHDARWLPRARVGFVRDATTPMGGGLAAVDADSPGALSYEEAGRLAAASGARDPAAAPPSARARPAESPERTGG